MGKYFNNFIVNLGLLIFGFLTVFSGLLIQIQYHLGNHGTNDYAIGINYSGWSDIHKISIVSLSILMIFHIIRHWKWFKTVIKKRLISKNKQAITLTLLFVLVAITGFFPWFIYLTKGDEMIRITFIEIHDKLAIILSIYFVLHVIKRLKWFFTAFEKLTN